MNKGAEQVFSKLENRLLCFFVRTNLIQSPKDNSKICYLQIILYISMDFLKKMLYASFLLSKIKYF